jgi:hypothetical protein
MRKTSFLPSFLLLIGSCAREEAEAGGATAQAEQLSALALEVDAALDSAASFRTQRELHLTIASVPQSKSALAVVVDVLDSKTGISLERLDLGPDYVNVQSPGLLELELPANLSAGDLTLRITHFWADDQKSTTDVKLAKASLDALQLAPDTPIKASLAKADPSTPAKNATPKGETP